MNNQQIEHIKIFLHKCKIQMNELTDLDGMLIPREILLDPENYKTVKEDISILKNIFNSSALTSLLPSSYTKNISNNNNAAVSSVITTDQKPMSFLSKHILRRDSKKSNPSAGSSILTDNTTDTTSKSDSNNYFLNMFRCSPNFDGAAPYSQDQCSSNPSNHSYITIPAASKKYSSFNQSLPKLHSTFHLLD